MAVTRISAAGIPRGGPSGIAVDYSTKELAEVSDAVLATAGGHFVRRINTLIELGVLRFQAIKLFTRKPNLRWAKV